MHALFASFGIAMLIGVLCIYGVPALLFKDFLQPVTILAALPLSIGGAFVALLITHSAMSMPAMIGLLMLMGVATKNSILLVEYAIVARRGVPAADGRPAVAPMGRFEALTTWSSLSPRSGVAWACSSARAGASRGWPRASR